MSKQRVIIISDFITTNVYDPVLALSKKYNIDLILPDPLPSYYQDYKKLLSEQNEINVLQYKLSFITRVFIKILSLLPFISKRKILEIRLYFKKIMIKSSINGRKYLFGIGIEKFGLILLNQVLKTKCTIIYYSLEIYDKPYSTIKVDMELFNHIRTLEAAAHRNADITLIQDYCRWLSIQKYNSINNENKLFFPVSVPCGINNKKGFYLENQFPGIANRKIILAYGLISSWRKVDEIAKVFIGLNEYALVIHGPGEETEKQKIRDISLKANNIFLSEELIDLCDINKVISSAYIALSLYLYPNDNNRFALFSSERNARYCQNGIPFITLRIQEYDEVYEKYKYFEPVESINQLPDAIKKIDNEYDNYRRNAFIAFEQFYSMDKNIEKLIGELENHERL